MFSDIHAGAGARFNELRPLSIRESGREESVIEPFAAWWNANSVPADA